MSEEQDHSQNDGDTRLPHVPTHSAVVNGTLLEAVFRDGKPAFLTNHDKRVQFLSEFTYGDVVYVPVSAYSVGYDVYEFDKEDKVEECPDMNLIVSDLLKVWGTFIDTDTAHIVLNVATVLMSYQAHKLNTVPYLGFFGDNETGKGQRETLHHKLDYRALLATDVTEANVYQYLDDVHGTIIEDEFDGIDKQYERLKIWKAGYKNGARVPRVIMSNRGTRSQHFFDVYGFKVAAGERLPANKGLNERFIVEYTVYGQPTKDEIETEDYRAFSLLRKRLLLWRVHTFRSEFPPLDLPFKGRIKELFKPLLQVAYGTELYDPLMEFLLQQADDKVKFSQESLEAKITVAAVKALAGSAIPIEHLRNTLAVELDGEVLLDKGGHPWGIGSDAYGRVSNRLIANKLRLLFRAAPDRTRQDNEQFRIWKVDTRRLWQEVKKYRLEADGGLKPYLDRAFKGGVEPKSVEAVESVNPPGPNPNLEGKTRESPVETQGTVEITGDRLKAAEPNMSDLEPHFGMTPLTDSIDSTASRPSSLLVPETDRLTMFCSCGKVLSGPGQIGAHKSMGHSESKHVD
jgi:hypothetical protein